MLFGLGSNYQLTHYITIADASHPQIRCYDFII